ncbi:MAG: S1C family serine protease [Clostridia bacterium]|nr:S1C family serine protease [Clostridia bacterium]
MKRVLKLTLSLFLAAALSSACLLAGCSITQDDSIINVIASDDSSADASDNTAAGSVPDSSSADSSGTDSSSEDNSSGSVTYVSSGLSVDYEVVESAETTYTVSENLLSVATVYADTVRTYSSNSYGPHASTSFSYHDVYTGSSVIFSVADDYVYFVTCYHVIYNEDEGQVADDIYVYLYGSGDEAEVTDYQLVGTTAYYTEMNYGDNAIECEYVGGSWAEDVAVLKASTESVLAINEQAKAVTFCENYSAGDTAVAIGNYAGEGISVTEGSVAVQSEEISLTLGSDTSSFRVMRLDLNIYEGNSGCGLFDENGCYIGMINAMSTVYTNYTFAIPADVVLKSIENIIYYANYHNMYTADLGIEVEASSSKYVYDSVSRTGEIVEAVKVTSVASGSAADEMELQTGDIIKSVTVDGVEYEVTRTYDIEDLQLIIFADSKVVVTYERGGETSSAEYQFTSENVSKH